MEKEILEVLESYNEYLGKIPFGSEYIANNLREDNIADALKAISNFSEGVIWITEANKLLNAGGVNAEMDIDKIKEFFIEINEGLENKDYLLVADLFEYEIATFFSESKQVTLNI